MKVILVLLATVAAYAAAMGVCYDTYNPRDIDKHFRTIKQRFSVIRTYQTWLWSDGRNAIDAAADNGLDIYAGIWLRDGMDFNKEIQAVINGYRRHPGSVKAVFVGNEDLMNNWQAWQVKQKVLEAKDRFRQAGINVRVGSVQTDGDWLKNQDLANACDIIGVNIYAFFGGSPNSWNNPIQDLNDRWWQIKNKYGGKAMLTETGWPHGGGNNGQHVSNPANAINYFYKVQDWVTRDGNGGESPMYFMYHDNRHKPGYEGQFGLANTNGDWKFQFGPSPGPGPTNAPVIENPRLKAPFQLITSKGKALREWYGGVAAPDANVDKYSVWYYNLGTQQIYSRGADKCIDAFTDNGQFKVHVFNCDANNNNQKWRIANNKVVHATINNLCLDADPTAANGAVQVWQCGDNNPNQVFTVADQVSHVTLQSGNVVLAVGDGDSIGFRPVQGSLQADKAAQWTFDHAKNTVASEGNGRCLDAWEAKNGATVHSWACDDSNANQKWIYDAGSKQLKHAKHQGFCLDMASDAGDHPYLWQCHDASTAWAKYQQFDYVV